MDVGERAVRSGGRRDGTDLAGDRRVLLGSFRSAKAAFHCSMVAAWPGAERGVRLGIFVGGRVLGRDAGIVERLVHAQAPSGRPGCRR